MMIKKVLFVIPLLVGVASLYGSYKFSNILNFFKRENLTDQQVTQYVVDRRVKRQQALQIPQANRQLFSAIKEGRVDKIMNAFKEGAAIEGLNISGRTPLIEAILLAPDDLSFPIVKYLIVTKKANILAKDSEGNTPLIHAVIKNYPEIVAFLIDKGAQVGSKNIHGKSALDYASSVEIKDILSKK